METLSVKICVWVSTRPLFCDQSCDLGKETFFSEPLASYPWNGMMILYSDYKTRWNNVTKSRTACNSNWEPFRFLDLYWNYRDSVSIFYPQHHLIEQAYRRPTETSVEVYDIFTGLLHVKAFKHLWTPLGPSWDYQDVSHKFWHCSWHTGSCLLRISNERAGACWLHTLLLGK